MTKFDQIFFPCVLLIIAAKSGSAIECYNCDSTLNPECNEIKKSASIKPVVCKPSVMGQHVGDWLKEITRIDFFGSDPEISVPMICQKIIAKNENGDKITFRGCQLDGAKSNVCDIAKSKAAKQTGVSIVSCDICMDDACNKSTQLVINLWSTLISATILLCMKCFY